MQPNFYVFFLAALIPMLVGAIWYNPKVLGTAWMKASGVTEEQARSGNMALIFGLSYLFSLFISFIVYSLVVHQAGIFSLLASEPGFAEGTYEGKEIVDQFMAKFGDKHRSFGHGSFHGVFIGLFFAMPVIAILSLFERRSFRYIAIHTGYWVVAIALMGGVIAQFA